MKVMTIIGTRPEFIQIAPLTKILNKHHTEVLVNTGQHYDDNMTRIFIDDLGLPTPSINLGVGSCSQVQQVCRIMTKLEPIMLQEKPDWVIVFGDTNTTVSSAIVAAKLQFPIAHIEAGLRSFDRRMPEEINRVLTDHMSHLLFAPTQQAVDNLLKEGMIRGVHKVGDVRVDLCHDISELSKRRVPKLIKKIGLSTEQPFALTTIHRPINTDNPDRLSNIIKVLNSLDLVVVLPVHPRLRKMMSAFSFQFGNNVKVIDPVGILDMFALIHACEIVITDSGGLQKEAYMLHRPAVTVRDSTEWIETIEAGWNRLCEANKESFIAAITEARLSPPDEHPDFYGEVNVCGRIVQILENNLERLPENDSETISQLIT